MKVLPIACLLPLTLAAQQDFEFTELLVDPVGANAGAQLVELTNNGPWPASLDGFRFASSGGVATLPTMTVPAGGIVTLHVAASGADTASDVYLPSLAPLGSSGAAALFRSAALTDPTQLVDFVSWGGGQAHIQTAITAAQWPNAAETLTPPGGEGWTYAHFDQVRYGYGNTASSWFVDTTPTLGAPNDGGGIFAGAYGCPLVPQEPQIGSGEEDNRPWIGETWHLDISYLPPTPSTIWLAIGQTTLGTVSLDALGVTGCFWIVAPDAVTSYLMPPSIGEVTVQVPNTAALTGQQFLLQAAVQYPGSNPAELLITRVMHAFVGSR